MNLIILAVFIGVILLFGSAYVSYRWSWKGAALLLPGIVLPFLIPGAGSSIPTLISPVLIGFMTGQTLKRKITLDSFLMVSALFLTLVYTGNFYYLKEYKNYNIVTESKTQMLEIIKNSSIPEENKKQLRGEIDAYLEIAEKIVPFSFFINSLVISLFGYFMVKILFSRLFGIFTVKGLEYFRLNDYTIFFLIGSWLSFLIVNRTEHEILSQAVLNAGLMVSALYLVQALGIIRFLLMRKNRPAYMLPLALIVTFILSIEAFIFIIILLTGFGTLDLWADFRKLNAGSMDQHKNINRQ